jgi:ubiquinone/menaquinone biosynthesis C-methylase UbiE
MRPSRAARITRQFEQRSAWWDRIYEQTSPEAQILRRRQQVALSWVDELSLAKGSQVLEIGSGAGLTAVQLAKRGHVVCALDRSPAMARLTREHALSSGVGQAVTPLIGNAHRLMFPDGAFGLVIALGVLSWLEDPNAAIDEMARVTQPGGHVLVTSLNSLDVARLLDPKRTPLSWPAKQIRRLAASAFGGPLPDQLRPTRHPAWVVRQWLRRSGLIPARQTMVGFGPFTFLGKPLLSANRSVRVGEVLQRRADSGGNVLRAAGRLYLVLAHKSDRA